MIIDGKKIAKEIIGKLKKLEKIKKFLAVFVIGGNRASFGFINQKKKIAGELDIDFRVYNFPDSVKQDDLRKEIVKMGKHKTCGGIVIQLPLPDRVNKHYVLNAIPREKDVDVLSERALGAFYANRNSVFPPAVSALEEILKIQKLEIENCNIAVVGQGFLVGKPITTWLSGRCPHLILLDKGGNFDSLKIADVVICGAGVPGLIKPEMLKENTLVVDFGYSMENGKITGDFDTQKFEIRNLKFKISFTPTPGGTGPILVAELFKNFFALNEG